MSKPNEEDQVLDQQGAIEETGCAELNEKVLLCYDEHKDWRKCKMELQIFRECYDNFITRIRDKGLALADFPGTIVE